MSDVFACLSLEQNQLVQPLPKRRRFSVDCNPSLVPNTLRFASSRRTQYVMEERHPSLSVLVQPPRGPRSQASIVRPQQIFDASQLMACSVKRSLIKLFALRFGSSKLRMPRSTGSRSPFHVDPSHSKVSLRRRSRLLCDKKGIRTDLGAIPIDTPGRMGIAHPARDLDAARWRRGYEGGVLHQNRVGNSARTRKGEARERGRMTRRAHHLTG